MSVKVVDKKTGKKTIDEYAIIASGQIGLYTDIMPGKRPMFPVKSLSTGSELAAFHS